MRAENQAFETLYKFVKDRGLIETKEMENAHPTNVYKGNDGTSKQV